MASDIAQYNTVDYDTPVYSTIKARITTWLYTIIVANALAYTIIQYDMVYSNIEQYKTTERNRMEQDIKDATNLDI